MRYVFGEWGSRWDGGLAEIYLCGWEDECCDAMQSGEDGNRMLIFSKFFDGGANVFRLPIPAGFLFRMPWDFRISFFVSRYGENQ